MVKETNISINESRLWDSLMEMAKIGPGIAGGNNRQTVTFEDGEARKLLQKWASESGMSMKVDVDSKMGIVSDVQQELREANARKILYSSIQTSDNI